jgi:type IV pilus assembly protein PilN
MPRINLLPWRQQERARRQREFGLAVVGAVLAAGAVTLLTSWTITAAIDRQNDRNALLKREISALDKQITEILDLENQKQRLVARMEIISKLQRSRPEIVHVFDQLVRTLPEGVYLTSVKQTDKRLEIRGVAQSSTRVSTFMRNIEASEWLTNPELQVIETAKSGSGSEFTLFATQKSSEPDVPSGPSRKGPHVGGKS